jgi:hypothetical protein
MEKGRELPKSIYEGNAFEYYRHVRAYSVLSAWGSKMQWLMAKITMYLNNSDVEVVGTCGDVAEMMS